MSRLLVVFNMGKNACTACKKTKQKESFGIQKTFNCRKVYLMFTVAQSLQNLSFKFTEHAGLAYKSLLFKPCYIYIFLDCINFYRNVVSAMLCLNCLQDIFSL